MTAPTRILIVDDSALYRQMIQNVLRDVRDVEVVGIAKNGVDAIAQIEALDPDLLTLDVQMPDMDGIGVLSEISARQLRTKAVMVSSLTTQGAQVTTDALLGGAFDFILKPSGPDSGANRAQLHSELTEKIDAFRQTAARFARRGPARPEVTDDTAAPDPHCRAVIIGTSTGGPAALKEVLPSLRPSLRVPIFVVQHMPAEYTASLARRLNSISAVEVIEAVDGQSARAGTVHLAPGGRHMKLLGRNDDVVVRITDDEPEHGCRPAVDYLLRSVARVYAGRALSVILTGMGRDGTAGCGVLKEQGGTVFAQHEDGCLVYGMPKAVIEGGLADRVLPLGGIGRAICRHVERSRAPHEAPSERGTPR